MGDKKRFVPVRGLEERIMDMTSPNRLGFNDGYVYFALDTGRIYIDYIDTDGRQVARAMVGNSSGGGGNSGIYYANMSLTAEEKLLDEIHFPKDVIEGNDFPQKDDLIVNIPEGSFYRVTLPSPLANEVVATRLTISGGGGTATLAENIRLSIEPLDTVNLINGQSANVYFTATSAKDNRGEPIESQIIITYTLGYTEDGYSYTNYQTGRFLVVSGERSSFDFGKIARQSSSSRLTLKASQINHESTMSLSVEFTTSNLALTFGSTFSNLQTFSAENLTLSCNAIGNMDKIIEYYFDDMTTPFFTKNLSSSSPAGQNVRVAEEGAGKVSLTHGSHKVAIRLFQSINGRKGLEVDPLIFEVAIVKGGVNTPIIWLGDYKTTYYNYDIIQIPFRVFDPLHPNATEVRFKKNNKELDNSPQTITENNKFSYFEISDAEINVLNRYSISCGEDENETSRDIELTIEVDPNRTQFHVQEPDYLIYMLDTVGSGRSNNEPELKRQTLVYNDINGYREPIAAKLSNFNWYNNGWMRDEKTNRTCLRISNGAQLSIPIGPMTFAGSTSGQVTHTIEIQFKVKNIQDYSTLIRNITRYKGDEDLFNLFYDTEQGTYKTKYTNYDSFLTAYLRDNVVYKADGVTRLEYDDLEFNQIQKQINLSNTFCKYYSNGIGLCLGPQDMFFSNGSNTVSASYVEEEIVTVSVVYQHGNTSAQKLIMVYINGILTSVIKNTNTNEFTIGSNEIVFNSDICDIDLYKIRVYDTSLNVNNIVMNYAVDFINVDIYDQNNLAQYNPSINEYYFDYQRMTEYNLAHPNDPLMPYIIFDTSYNGDKNNQKLSFSKSKKLNIGVEFVNTGLDLAYNSGELEELAKKDGLWQDNDSQEKKAEAIKTYYKHHCPSWKSDSGVQMAVQGTSSEFYPRRNYKLKTKTGYDSDGEDRVHIFLNRGPFAADYEADQNGLLQDKFILSNTSFNENETYYSDAYGENQVVVGTVERPYERNKYYVKNPLWVEFGKEKSRQKYWYMNNYTTGTTKWTMKIDYMESSGSYNMGFANLVKNGYSKHPLDDYNSAGAFQVEDPNKTTSVPTTTWVEGKEYWYLSHKNEWKSTKVGSDSAGDLTIINSDENIAEVFAQGPLVYAQAHGITKVLGLDKDTGELNPNYPPSTEGYNTWYERVPGYSAYTIPRTDDYRTSVGGFRVLAFHKKLKQNGEIYYQYIGMYNMLLDKGSDEVYGFKPDKTARSSRALDAPLVSPLQKFLKNKKISKIAECWEMENNSRTYCSFRDPDKRKDLSFDSFETKNGQQVRRLNSVRSAPIVTDSFEYRYHADADILDYVMDPDKNGDKYESEDMAAYIAKNGDLAYNVNDETLNQQNRVDFILNRYRNWEKACQWVWSTCTDYVISQGQYEEITVGTTLWTPNTFYILDNNEYIQDTSLAWDPDIIYYNREVGTDGTISYPNAHAVTSEFIFNNNNKNNFYIQVNGSYISCANEPEFNDSITYYSLINYEDNQMATLEAQNKVDRLVVKCTANDPFDNNAEYYTYDGTQQNGYATTKVNITAEEYSANPTNYYVGTTVTYKGKSYKYDTIEYRGDKFINELAKHFDIEYMATYFVMTEVFECYDSRGKNCMMASWGPLSDDPNSQYGNDYIWYPIFYDIDTQLGVNNTGIPSFEYNVDATEDGNYSTSDSVLWNNFYKYFKSSAILAKYKHLRHVTEGVSWPELANPPIESVDVIEAWYNTDPDVCHNLAMRGKRPLVAKNLDEYYKYITITNGSSSQDLADGLIGHLASNQSGEIVVDRDGQYFYMLQGDRSLSRRQFLNNRLEYIDSWLNQGNYARGGNNLIRGRISANNNDTSDKWIEPRDGSYYLDENEKVKRHLFDAEYWLTLTPTHSSYITLGDDNEAYPSQKYDGINPLKFKISAIEQGVRTSLGYPEQLLYVYGLNHMSDLGDMSKLYWREFSFSGSAEKLTSLKFGYDGVMEEDGEIIQYKNQGVNNFSIGAAKPEDEKAKGLPLLKYVNLSNILLSPSISTTVLDLTSCEKLENFRATNSNFTEFQFADGVALNTLYLPYELTTLKLTEVRLLKNLITEYHTPVLNAEGDLVAEPGLYLQGLFDTVQGDTKITTLNILGSGLGYNSYKLLKRYYDVRKRQTSSNSDIQMTNVQWSPFIQISEEEEWNANEFYFEDNGHYRLVPYSHNVDNWPVKTSNGEIYRLNTDMLSTEINDISEFNTNLFINDVTQIDDSCLDMLNVFASDSALFRTDFNNKVPNITGIIYINNATEVDEVEIRNELQPKFPHLTFFFTNVHEAYTAKFLLMDADEGENGTYKEIGSQTIDGETVTWFSDPIQLYGDISRQKQNHDFKGWATNNSVEHPNYLAKLDGSMTWPIQTLDSNKHTYYFYAICPIHSWKVKFFDGDTLYDTLDVPHGTPTTGPLNVPWRDDSALPLKQTYQFLGWNRINNATEPMDLSGFDIIQDTTFYSVWNSESVSVYDNVHPEWFEVTNNNYTFDFTNETGCEVRLAKAVKGKLTIPAEINGKPVLAFRKNPSLADGVYDSCFDNLTHVFIQRNQNGTVNLRDVVQHTFHCPASGTRTLRYFEFDAPGLYRIGTSAFQNVRNLSEVSIIGGTLQIIAGQSFTHAFNSEFGNVNLILDGSIVTLIATAFSAQTKIAAGKMTLQLGTDTSRASSFDGFGIGCFSGCINLITQVTIYLSAEAKIELENKANENNRTLNQQISYLLFNTIDFDETKIQRIE